MSSSSAKYLLSQIAGKNIATAKQLVDIQAATDAAELARLEGALEVLQICKPYIYGDEGESANARYKEGLTNLRVFKRQLERAYNFKFPASKKRKNPIENEK